MGASLTTRAGNAPPQGRSIRESSVAAVQRVGLNAGGVTRRLAGSFRPEYRLAVLGIGLGTCAVHVGANGMGSGQCRMQSLPAMKIFRPTAANAPCAGLTP